MSDLSMTEISKGVWVPRGTPFTRAEAAGGAGTAWPKEDECQLGSGCMLSALKHTHPAGLSAASVAALNPAGLPRRAAGVMNPEDDDKAFKEMVREAGSWALPHRPAGVMGGPLEPVAANTYEQAREMAAEEAAAQEKERQGAAARAAADALAAEDAHWAAVEAEEDARRKEEARVAAGKTWAADGGAVNGLGKDSHYYKEKYTETLWENAPERERPEPFAAAWYSCVERWHFVQLGGLCRHRIIIEVELHGGTSLRHILYLDQIKGVLTKSNNRDSCGYKVMEEVIIDMGRQRNSFSPEQVKFKFMGSANAMAFHLALIKALDRSF